MSIFIILLAILFIGLKLGAIIAWSWVWVLAPLWIGFALWIILMVVVVAIFGKQVENMKKEFKGFRK